MKLTLTLCSLLLAATSGLASAAAPVAQISDLAAQTGLTERQVQMVVGAHTAYAEYLTQYDWARRTLIQRLGAERYNNLMAGRTIRLDNGQDFRLASLAGDSL